MALTKVSYSMIEGAIANVLDFGAIGDGIANDTVAVQAAIDTGLRVRFPAGTYLINVNVANKTILEGDGSTATIIKPFDVSSAAITYTQTGNDWSYHSEVRNIGFTGIGTKTGVGFTFGTTNPANFTNGMQYANNVKFYGCRFINLEKGVQFPFGNIGSEFYSCGWSDNKYGVYTINNKFGGDGMHAGCKYFYAGEFSTNECAFYCNNTVDGFGAIVFNDTIIERNLIGVYIYSDKNIFTPISFNGVALESNGQMSTGAANVTIDSWSGTTRTNQTITKHAIIFDGNFGQYNFNNCGIFADVYVTGTYTIVNVNECRVETAAGFNGGICNVSNPESSIIRISNPYTDGGFLKGDSIVTVGRPTQTDPTMDPQIAANRWFITDVRASKIASYGPARAMSTPLTSAASTTGSFILTGSVVSDGQIYSSCNEFTRNAFASNEATSIQTPNTTITTSAGYYVFTLDFKRTLGNPKVSIWNRDVDQFTDSMEAPALNKWYTFAGIGYSAGGQTLYLDFIGSNENCTWRVSAYQILRFDTLAQAQSFLESKAFAES